MKYYLIIGNAKNGVKIDFSKLKEFKSLDSHKLKDIVKFTHSFISEQELILYLKYNGLVDRNFDNITIGIYKNEKEDEKLEKLRYGVSFKNDSMFYDIEQLKHYFIRNLTSTKFMKSFIGKYYAIYEAKKGKINNNDPLVMIPSIYSIYMYYLNNGRILQDGEAIMEEFITRYCHDYANLRDLAMFVIDYNKKRNNIKSNIETIKELKTELLHYKFILENSSITEEQQLAYQNKIKRLEEDIEMRSGR